MENMQMTAALRKRLDVSFTVYTLHITIIATWLFPFVVLPLLRLLFGDGPGILLVIPDALLFILAAVLTLILTLFTCNRSLYILLGVLFLLLMPFDLLWHLLWLPVYMVVTNIFLCKDLAVAGKPRRTIFKTKTIFLIATIVGSLCMWIVVIFNVKIF